MLGALLKGSKACCVLNQSQNGADLSSRPTVSPDAPERCCGCQWFLLVLRCSRLVREIIANCAQILGLLGVEGLIDIGVVVRS